MLALPESWASPRIADVGAVRVGRQRTPAQMTGRHGTPYLRAGNITEGGLDLDDVLTMDFTPAERETYALRDGDILLAEGSGSATQVGRPAMWRGELPLCCFQNTIIRFRPHAALSEYALAVFRHYVASGIFARTARGIGLLHLGARRFAELPFPLPPLSEQQRIVTVLDAKLDELRAARAALRSALDGTDRQDTEILAAAATGRLLAADDRQLPPAQTGTGLPERHPVLASWRWSTVGEVGELTLGKTLGPSNRRGRHVRPYLRVANVLEDHIDLTDLKETEFSDEELARYALRAGDILLNDGQSPELVGRPAMYLGELSELYYQNHLIRFRPREGVLADFALLVFRHYLRAGEFRRLARGSTNIANLSRSRLAGMPFPVPPPDVQQAVVDDARRRLKASADQRHAIRSSLAHADEMTSEFLSAAASGRLSEQESTDETATDLLARIGPPPRDRGARARRPAQRSRPRPADQRTMTDLTTVLDNAERSMSVPELVRAAGVDVNSVDAIEEFYLALRAALGTSLRLVRGTGEEAEIEAVDHAAR